MVAVDSEGNVYVAKLMAPREPKNSCAMVRLAAVASVMQKWGNTSSETDMSVAQSGSPLTYILN